MADTTADLKSSHLPVDPDVKVPDQVRRATERVNAMFAQQPVPEQQGSPPAEPVQEFTPPPADVPPAPALESEPPAPEPEPHIPVQGRYSQKQVETIRQDHQRQLDQIRQQHDAQMRQLGDELLRTQEMQRQARQRAQQTQPVPQMTDKDVQEFGPDVIDFTQRAARVALAPELLRMQQENEQLRRNQAQQNRRALDQAVAMAVPNYREIDANPRWRQWLMLPEPYTGRIRQEILNDAITASDALRVVTFFRGFLAEEQATGHAPAPTPDSAFKPPREAAVPLASLASPGRARPASGGDTPMPPDKPFYSRADIQKAHRAYMQGAYRGREAEYTRLQDEFVRAGAEGRIRS